MPYKIGSFNVRNMSLNSGKDINKLIEIINKFDVVVLEEVLSEGKQFSGEGAGRETSLLRRLGRQWDCQWVSPETNAKDYPYLSTDNRHEGYEFIWRMDKFELLKNRFENDDRPHIFSGYHVDSSVGELMLKRSPALGRFKVKGRTVEIRLLATHIIYGKSKLKSSDEDDGEAIDTDINNIRLRKNEFYVLAHSIYPRVAEYYKQVSCTVPYTIILGDYNLNIEGTVDATSKAAVIPEVVCYEKNGNVMKQVPAESSDITYSIFTDQKMLTTINRKNSSYANSYDHFSYDNRVKENVCLGSVRRINPEEMELNIDEYYDRVSDHMPVILELDV